MSAPDTCDSCRWHRTFYDDEGVGWFRPARRFLSSVGPDGCSCEHPAARDDDHVCAFVGSAGFPEVTQGTSCNLRATMDAGGGSPAG